MVNILLMLPWREQERKKKKTWVNPRDDCKWGDYILKTRKLKTEKLQMDLESLRWKENQVNEI